jgi:hypothetical protein
MKMGEDEPEE